DQTPEAAFGLDGAPANRAFARSLAEAGCVVVVPTLIDRRDEWSGNPNVRFTNPPHREWIYRQAYQMGRHLIGYEVQKTSAAVDWLEAEASRRGVKEPAVGVVGYGEGGLVAFYAAAADERIDVALVAGYFGPREAVAEEPIYRNVFGLLDEFGDAETASLIAPRGLVVGGPDGPIVTGPPAPRPGRTGAAPGRLAAVAASDAERELRRARTLVGRLAAAGDRLVGPIAGDSLEVGYPAFYKLLGAKEVTPAAAGSAWTDARTGSFVDDRQQRQVAEQTEHTQRLLRRSPFARQEFLKKAPTNDLNAFQKANVEYKKYLWEEVFGRLPDPSVPSAPKTRKLFDRPKWTGYEVVLDVWPG
ncbi:MAG: dienelactone hydrolase family protein, partial [Planctomycetia bacterium]